MSLHTIVKPMVFLFAETGGPWGTYDLNEDNSIERQITKLELLRKVIAEQQNRLAENGDILDTIFEKETTALAEKVWAEFEYFALNGVNIFEYSKYMTTDGMKKYQSRPCAAGHMNAGPEECIEGCPGWWWDFPGHANKWFHFGNVVIDCDDNTLRVGVYDDEDHDIPTQWIEIRNLKQPQDIFDNFSPEVAVEIVKVCLFVYNEYNEYHV